MAFQPGQAINEAGLDSIIASTRVRATVGPVTFTDSTGSVTLTSTPIGVNYVDGIGAPFSTSVGAGTSITLAASNILTGVIVLRLSTSGTSSVTATTDTATNLSNAATAVCPSGLQPGDYMTVLIMNDGNSSLIIATGTGVTSQNSSYTSIPAQTSRYTFFRNNNLTSWNMYF